MMDLFAAIIYGIIQGLTEFLPISSSGHLALLPHFTSLGQDPGIFFDLLLHLGTVLSVLIYYRRPLRRLWPLTQALPLSLIVTTVVSGLLMIILESTVAHYGRRPSIIALNLAFWGIILWWADRRADKTSAANTSAAAVPTTASTTSSSPSPAAGATLWGQCWHRLKTPMVGTTTYLKAAVVLGLAQALAAFPGVSRSGITLTFARGLKLSKDQAVEYSFLMAIPVIVGGVIWKSLHGLYNPASLATLPPWPYVLVGVGTSCLVGLMAIHSLLWALRKWGAGIFALYRLGLAAAIWWWVS